MLGLSETTTPCQEYEKQWRNSRGRHCSRNLIFVMGTTISDLPRRTDIRQPSKHAMERTSQKSCTLECVMLLHSSKEPCEVTSLHFWNSTGRIWVNTWTI